MPSDKNRYKARQAARAADAKPGGTRGKVSAQRLVWLRFRDNLLDPIYLAPPAAFAIRHRERQTETEQRHGSDAGSAGQKARDISERCETGTSFASMGRVVGDCVEAGEIEGASSAQILGA